MAAHATSVSTVMLVALVAVTESACVGHASVRGSSSARAVPLKVAVP